MADIGEVIEEIEVIPLTEDPIITPSLPEPTEPIKEPVPV